MNPISPRGSGAGRDHFDEMTALLFLENQLEASRAREVSSHLESCGACQGLLRALENENVWLREALAADAETIPAHLVAAPERDATHWGWTAAFGLGAAGVYTLWSGLVEPWVERASQAGFTQGNILTMLFFSGAFWKGWDSMRTLMEFMALATLGSVTLWLLRRHWQRFTTVAVILGAMVCALALPPAAQAADVHGGPNYTLAAGQEVPTDLILAADRVRIDGDVDGDLIVTGQIINVNGHVKGDIIAFCQELRVNGPVDGNVRAFCQTVSLNSTVAKNVMAGGFVELNEKATVAGTLTLFSGVSEINGRVSGDLLAFVGDLSINGWLGHDARIRSDRLTIGPDAQIQGQTRVTGRHEPDVAAGAKLGSPVVYTKPKQGPDYTRPAYYWHQTLYWGASFVFGLVLLFLAPGFFFDAGQTSKRIGPAMGLGLLFLLTPIVALIICFTIVGIGVAITAMFLWAIAVYASQVIVGSWLGETVLGPRVGVAAAVGRLALGLALLRMLRMLPFLGSWITVIVIVWGLGAIVLALHRKMRPHLAVAAAAA
jgi:cytoskeletal protein CcmA (bactofilin family)